MLPLKTKYNVTHIRLEPADNRTVSSKACEKNKKKKHFEPTYRLLKQDSGPATVAAVITVRYCNVVSSAVRDCN